MKIEVLGSGCATRKALFTLTQKAATELGMTDDVVYVTGDEGVNRIIELGAMRSPVLVINNEIAMTGGTSDINQIKTLLQKTQG